jgi:hypothetical protein
MGFNHRPFAWVDEHGRRLAAAPCCPRRRLPGTLASLLAALEFLGIVLLLGAGACLGQGANPDHLEPISPYDPIGYGQAAFSALIGKHRAEFWMMCLPSVHPEWAVILRAESEHAKSEASAGSKPDALSDPGEKQKWVIESAVASQPVASFRKNAKVDRKRMEIDEASANALREAWTAVTRKTRYAEGNTGGFDGVTYQFYSNGQYGETWSPAAGLPAALIELGGRLAKCVGSAAENREALLQEAVGMARDIKSKAGAAGARAP